MTQRAAKWFMWAIGILATAGFTLNAQAVSYMLDMEKRVTTVEQTVRQGIEHGRVLFDGIKARVAKLEGLHLSGTPDDDDFLALVPLAQMSEDYALLVSSTMPNEYDSWACKDVPCSEAAQCPPTCSTCDFDEDAGEMRCQR